MTSSIEGLTSGEGRDLAERIRAAVTYQYMPMAVRTLLSEAAKALAATPAIRQDEPEGAGVPIPHGWALVPIEPTTDMVNAAVLPLNRTGSVRRVWSAMLAASPRPAATYQAGEVA